MNEFDFNSDATSTVFRDVILLALAGFICIVVLLLPYINPPKKQEAKDMPPPGNIIVQMFWDDSMDMDIDLWCKAPGDQPVGYSTMSGTVFNLLRDDLGFYQDTSGRNFELAVTRGIVPGEYIINTMFYADKRKTNKVFPIEVHIIVSIKRDANSPLEKLFDRTVKLYKEKEEVTVIRFTLDSRSYVIRNSINSLFKPMAGYYGSGGGM